jgi:hypothetical protein
MSAVGREPFYSSELMTSHLHLKTRKEKSH